MPSIELYLRTQDSFNDPPGQPTTDPPTQPSTDSPGQAQSSESVPWIHGLTVPQADIERLTLRPLKWLRFVAFAICGAKGDLSATPNGDVVDYETLFDNLASKYYFVPDGEYHLVDYKCINDRCTSSIHTSRSQHFRQAIKRRDIGCAVTQTEDRKCYAAHIIPRSKGDGYITFVVQDRSFLYDNPSLEDISIDSVQNGMLLRKDLHSDFGCGAMSFLRTPNFAMTPSDVPRVEQDLLPHRRTTLQQLVAPGLQDRLPVPQLDAIDWPIQAQAPPNILLDFMYAAAVLKLWKSKALENVLKNWFDRIFAPVLTKPPSPLTPDEDEEMELEDDPTDQYFPSSPRNMQDASEDLLRAMDEVWVLSALLQGATPQSMAEEFERQNRESQLRAQERSHQKVEDWLGLA